MPSDVALRNTYHVTFWSRVAGSSLKISYKQIIRYARHGMTYFLLPYCLRTWDDISHLKVNQLGISDVSIHDEVWSCVYNDNHSYQTYYVYFLVRYDGCYKIVIQHILNVLLAYHRSSTKRVKLCLDQYRLSWRVPGEDLATVHSNSNSFMNW